MESLKQKLISIAQDKFSTILPYNGANDIYEGFSVVGDVLLFWFDTIDQSSHLVSERI